ncbi:MAG: kelch repeat-containing protein [Candidatus Binataceae bacterium]
MASSSVTVNAVNSSNGSSLTPALATTTTDSGGNLSVSIPSQSGPVRITVSGGSFSSEMNSATINSPSTVSLLLSSAGGTSVSGLSVNPLSTFVDSRTVGLLAAGGTTFSTALSNATTQIENIYGLSTDPGTLTPTYTTTGTDAANLGLILGAIINEDQYLCPATPGGLVTALSSDIADGIFDGLGSGGSAVIYCSGNLPAIAGITDFQDALSGLTQLQNVTAAFAFGGSGNILTTNGLADLALNGSEVYPSAPLETIDSAIPSAAPSAVNTFASSGSTASMNAAREAATETLLPNGNVLIAGGQTGGGTNLSSTDLYDPSTNTFASSGSTASMNVAREQATAMLLPNGLVLIAGGQGNSGFLSSTELYDPADNTFASSGSTVSMNTARTQATATLLPNGLLLIAGGLTTGGVHLSTTELYNSATNTFASSGSTASMNTARDVATATLLPNGLVLIAGGSNGPVLASTELYDPASNTFASSGSTATMNTGRDLATATLLPNGKVLIAGGQSGGGAFLASTELYDPASNTFASSGSTATMNTGRVGAVAILLPNGKVLIAGGIDNSGRLSSTELYDPVSNTFASSAATASMNAGREFPTGTLLPNGKVLVAGGQGNSAILSSTDLYTP